MGFAPKRRYIAFTAIVILVLLVGIIGYCLIEIKYEKPIEGEENAKGKELIVDSIYWTVVTLSTLGSYPSGVELTSIIGKIFTVFTVLLGIITIFIAFPLAISPLLEERMKNIIKPKTMPIPNKNHVIICGYSDLGKEVINELKMHEIKFVVIEKDENKIKKLSDAKIPFIFGNPSEEQILKKSNIDSAISLITVTDDSLNAFICLTAKKISPSIRIVTNVQTTKNIKILKRAGAGTVISPKSTAGILLGRQVTTKHELDITNTLDFFGNLEIIQQTITTKSALIGKTLLDAKIREKSGVLIFGIWRKGEFKLNPSSDQILNKEDILIVMGTKKQIRKLREVL